MDKNGKQMDSKRQGLPDGWTRASFIVRESYLKRLKDISHFEGKSIKSIVDEVFNEYLSKQPEYKITKKPPTTGRG